MSSWGVSKMRGQGRGRVQARGLSFLKNAVLGLGLGLGLGLVSTLTLKQHSFNKDRPRTRTRPRPRPRVLVTPALLIDGEEKKETLPVPCRTFEVTVAHLLG